MKYYYELDICLHVSLIKLITVLKKEKEKEKKKNKNEMSRGLSHLP